MKQWKPKVLKRRLLSVGIYLDHVSIDDDDLVLYQIGPTETSEGVSGTASTPRSSTGLLLMNQ